MDMTQRNAVRAACTLTALVYHSRGDYTHASDGFCDRCPYSSDEQSYQNSGDTLRYIRAAILVALARDGFTPREDILTELADLIGFDDEHATECSICRSKHGPEIIHACE